MPTDLDLLETIRRHGTLDRLPLAATEAHAHYMRLTRAGSIMRTRGDTFGFWDLTDAGVRLLNRLFLEPLILKVA